jgi:uncharacterized protein DUF3467
MPETSKTPSPKEPPKELPTKKADTFASIYASAANVDVTPYDFRIAFGEMKKSGTEFSVEHYVEVKMSPQHAKALTNILVQYLHEYEKNIGEIHLPKAPEGTPAPQSAIPSVAKSA